MARSTEAFLCKLRYVCCHLGMLSMMLLFRFEGHKTATCKDLAIAWSTPVLLDWAIVHFLLGLILWYADKSDRWRGLFVLACHYHIDCSLDVAGHESQWGLGAEEWPKVAATA